MKKMLLSGLIGLTASAAAPGAVLTTKVLYDFDGSISGSTYTETGGLPATATVLTDSLGASPIIAGGVATTTNDMTGDEGLIATCGGSGINLVNTNFVAEA